MNPLDLLKNLNLEELKKKSEETMLALKQMKITGEAGGGFVKVTINGDFMILSIEYEKSDLLKDDVSAFKDLIISAHNDAVAKMKDEMQKRFAGAVAPGMF
jgi:nucleoid-associated protein EbfC